MNPFPLAVLAAFISSVGLCLTFFYVSKIRQEAKSKLRELATKVDDLAVASANASAAIAQAKAALDTKITKSAMQSITKQAKEITGAVISEAQF
jgi:hypothetical protein